jgi:hypothetical protein
VNNYHHRRQEKRTEESFILSPTRYSEELHRNYRKIDTEDETSAYFTGKIAYYLGQQIEVINMPRERP